jgi:hypothetical protein
LVVVLVMLVIVVAAAAVVTYVAFPARGRAVPHVPWLGEALDRGAEKGGLFDDDAADAQPPRR